VAGAVIAGQPQSRWSSGVRLAPAVLLVALAACGGPPQPLPADQIPAAFIALTQAPGRTMHMEWSGTYTADELNGGTYPFTAVLDFAGPDYAGTVEVPSASEKDGGSAPAAHTEVAFVDGVQYERTSYQGVWRRTDKPQPFFDPFGGLTAAQVEYAGAEERNGAKVHHLRLLDADALAQRLFGSMQVGLQAPAGFDTYQSEFDFYVDDFAHPVSAALDVAIESAPNDFTGPSVKSTYTFSNWNADIYIIPPPSPQ
jgi:hypothetical protein